MRAVAVGILLLLLTLPPTLAADSLPAAIHLGDQELTVYMTPDDHFETYDASTFEKTDEITLRLDNDLRSVSFSEDLLYVGLSDGRVAVYDLRGKKVAENRFENAIPRRMLRIGDGFFLALYYSQESRNELIKVDADDFSGKQIIATPEGSINSLTTDGTRLYMGSTLGVMAWDLDTLEETLSLTTQENLSEAKEEGYAVKSVNIVGDKLYTAHSNHRIRMWNLETGEVLKEIGLEGDIPIMHDDDDYLYAPTGTPRDGTRVLAVLDTDLERVATIADDVTPLNLKADDDRLYVFLSEGAVRIYEKGSWKLLGQLGQLGEAEPPAPEPYDMPEAPVNLALPVFIGIAILFLLALLVELRGAMRKQRTKSFRKALSKAIAETFSIDDLIKLLIVAGVAIALIGILRPLTVFPKWLPGISWQYYFDVFIGSGAFLILWIGLPPLLVYKYTEQGPLLGRVLLALIALLVALGIRLLAPAL